MCALQAIVPVEVLLLSALQVRRSVVAYRQYQVRWYWYHLVCTVQPPVCVIFVSTSNIADVILQFGRERRLVVMVVYDGIILL